MALGDDTKVVELAAEMISQSEKAVLLDFGDKQKWVPKSQCEWARKGHYDVAEWWAKKEGLI